MDNKMMTLAKFYLERGWSVLPCGKNKIPLVNWKQWQERYPTEAEIESWFEAFPDAQVGIITGKLSNLTVVDIEKGGDPSFLPQDTMIVQTGGGGYHYLYLYEDGVTNKARIKDLVDIRSEGGYIVAAGSISEKGPYTLLQDVPLLPFPKELFPDKPDIFQYPGSSTFEKREIEEYPGYGEGQRNDEMARYIGYILTQTHPLDWDTEGWALIVKANDLNTPPLSHRELQATFESIKRTEKRNNPFGRRGGDFNPLNTSPSNTFGSGPTILDDETDEIRHVADVADSQHLDETDVYPLQMPCFDDVIFGGVAPGDLVTIAGKSGHGKTSLAQDWSLSFVRGENPAKVLWFSYEVLPTHLWKKFQEMGMSREDCIFTPAKNTTGHVAWVEQKIKEGKEKFGIKMVMIDHLGFLLPQTQGILGKNLSSNYASFLTQITRDLKALAIREEVAIFLPVHVRKSHAKSQRSDIDDIKDSSGIGQESDLVFLIERERSKDENSKSYFTDITTITLAKNRKTGVTVIGKFNMIDGRFAYDETSSKADVDFENIDK